MRAPGILLPLTAAVCLFAVAAPGPAEAAMMGWYIPLHLGGSWTYQNPDPPYDFYVDTVFEEIVYEGDPAFRMGQDLDDHIIVYRDQGVITVYAMVEGGVFRDFSENIVLGEITDGDNFGVCSDVECDSSLIRFWDDLDPSLRSIYRLDPALEDMILFASYDSDYPPNLQNVVVESNLPVGVTPPTGAVTGLEWYLRSVGTVLVWDVDAASGGLEVRHFLALLSAAGDTPAATPVLHQNTPNPFNPTTTIAFDLPVDSRVDLRVYDVGGRLVRTLLPGALLTAGRRQAVWRGRDDAGQPVAAGVYFYEFVAGDRRETRSMMLLK